MCITLSMLEAYSYLLHSLSLNLITVSLFSITEKANVYPKASRTFYISLCYYIKMDNRLLLRLEVGMLPLHFLLLTHLCLGFCCVSFGIHCFVNRLSKDICLCCSPATIEVIDQADEPHAENLIS